MDVDGVLTDGRIVYDDRGQEYKFFDVHDGFGIHRGMNAGLLFAIITGRKSPIVARRAKELHIRDVIQGQHDKLASLHSLKKRYHCRSEEICAMSDDENDIPFLQAAGVSAAPSSAMARVKRTVDIVTRNPGGRGAVREIVDMILEAQGRYSM